MEQQGEGALPVLVQGAVAVDGSLPALVQGAAAVRKEHHLCADAVLVDGRVF
jgi:hypothetical protein